LAHALWQRGHRFPARTLSQFSRWFTGIEIHPGATIGHGLFIDHGMGVVIGETAEVGSDVMLYHGVTLGGTSLEKGKRHPTVGDRVTVGAGAKLLGPITVGDDSKVGANAVVVKSVPAGSVVVGVPGQVISRPGLPARRATVEDGDLPDVVGRSVVQLLDRVTALEDRLELDARERAERIPVGSFADGVWSVEDFSI
ncbi:MAG: serine O-acetyltransferase, partial [Acidimicrobiia bacterium]|nr:serine O-acetyltransferase [Acidimicrobiia bacterium]